MMLRVEKLRKNARRKFGFIFGYQSVQSSLLNELYRYDRISCYYFGKAFLLLIFVIPSRRQRRLKGLKLLKMSDLFLMR